MKRKNNTRSLRTEGKGYEFQGPELGHSDILRFLISMPFFRLDFRFKCDLDRIFKDAGRPPVKGGREHKTLEQHLKATAVKLKNDKTLAFVFSRMPSGPNSALFEKTESHDEFLRQLSTRHFKPEYLRAYFQQVRSLLLSLMTVQGADDVHMFSTVELNSLIYHLARSRNSLSPADREALMLDLEKVLADVRDTLGGVIDAHKLTVAQVQLIGVLGFFYIVASELLNVAVHPSVIQFQITLWRRAGLTFWQQLPSRARLDHALVTIQLLVRHFPLDKPFQTKSGFSLGVFEEIREILVGARECMRQAEYTYEKTVFDWFITRLNQDIFVGRGYSEPSILLQSLSKGEHGIIQDFAQGSYSYRYPVTIERIYAFLGQFPTLEMMKAVVRLLTQIRYIPLARLGELVEDSIASVAQPRQAARIVPLGDLAGSTSIVRYLASHSARLGARLKTSSVEEALRTTADQVDLIFADDSCLSGTQAINTFKELVGQRKLKPHHTKHADKLPDDLIKKLKQRKLRFCFAAATDFGINRLKSEVSKLGYDQVGIQASYLEALDHKVFRPHFSWLWRNRKEMESCKTFFCNVGEQILERRALEKKWDSSRRKESALGFSDFQRLLVFQHNVPKTTLTALWENGEYNGKKWIPLFPGSD